MIDLGETLEGSKVNANYVAERLIEILGKKEIDVLVITHYHIDHTGYTSHNEPDKMGGIVYLIEELGFTFKKFIDRDCGEYVEDDITNCKWGTIDWHNIDEEGPIHTRLVCYGSSLKDKTKLSSIREIAKLCSSDQIDPPDEGANVQIIMRDAYGVKYNDKNLFGNRIGSDKDGGINVNENDYSICLKITYGDFAYSTCGDLSGINQDKEYDYHDIETVTAPMMGEVDLYHANHHGIDSSTNQLWVNTLKPRVTIVSCGTCAFDKEEVERLVNVGSVIYGTGNCLNYWAENKLLDEERIFYDDVVVTVPKGSDTFYVSRKDGSDKESYFIKKNKTPGECKILPL